jgi:hypothetical protein
VQSSDVVRTVTEIAVRFLFVVPPIIVAVLVVAALGRRRPPAVAVAVAYPGRRWDAIAQAIIGPSGLGPILPMAASAAAILIGTQLTVAVTHDKPILETIAIVAAGSFLTGIGAAAAWALAWPPRARRTYESFVWLGEWELDRLRALTAGTVRATREEMTRYVQTTTERPEDRWLRADVLAATGQVDLAREVAGRIPDDTPYGRVERAAGLAYTDWLTGGPGDPVELRDAVGAIEPADGDERLRAEVILACSEVRRRISAGERDVLEPLRAVRDRLGRRANGALFLAARRMIRGFLLLATGFVVVFTVLDRATSL